MSAFRDVRNCFADVVVIFQDSVAILNIVERNFVAKREGFGHSLPGIARASAQLGGPACLNGACALLFVGVP